MILQLLLSVMTTFGQNITYCPTNCTCIVNDLRNLYSVNCLDESYDTLPENMPSNISRIDMSRNQFTSFSIKSVEAYSTTLASLTLKNNRIRRFDMGTSGIEFASMTDIDVSYNQIQYIDWNMLLYFPQLRTFRINGNKLTSLTGILSNIKPGLVLYLLDNPFYCSCQAIKFTKYVTRQNVRHQFAKFDKMLCNTNNPLPNTIQAEHLAQLTGVDDCEPENLYFSVYDRGSQRTLTTNVTGEYILPLGSRNGGRENDDVCALISHYRFYNDTRPSPQLAKTYQSDATVNLASMSSCFTRTQSNQPIR